MSGMRLHAQQKMMTAVNAALYFQFLTQGGCYLVLVDCPKFHQFDFDPSLGEIKSPVGFSDIATKKYHVTCHVKNNDGTDCGIEFIVEV
jgi:hypothetical protein